MCSCEMDAPPMHLGSRLCFPRSSLLASLGRHSCGCVTPLARPSLPWHVKVPRVAHHPTLSYSTYENMYLSFPGAPSLLYPLLVAHALLHCSTHLSLYAIPSLAITCSLDDTSLYTPCHLISFTSGFLSTCISHSSSSQFPVAWLEQTSHIPPPLHPLCPAAIRRDLSTLLHPQ